eukprot:scaffold24329_cov101-Isochrysis_galbana.AAC.2
MPRAGGAGALTLRLGFGAGRGGLRTKRPQPRLRLAQRPLRCGSHSGGGGCSSRCLGRRVLRGVGTVDVEDIASGRERRVSVGLAIRDQQANQPGECMENGRVGRGPSAHGCAQRRRQSVDGLERFLRVDVDPALVLCPIFKRIAGECLQANGGGRAVHLEREQRHALFRGLSFGVPSARL